MPRDSAAADRPASYLVGTAAAFPLFFRDRAKPINQLPFSPSAKFPKSGSSCESRVRNTLPSLQEIRLNRELSVQKQKCAPKCNISKLAANAESARNYGSNGWGVSGPPSTAFGCR